MAAGVLEGGREKKQMNLGFLRNRLHSGFVHEEEKLGRRT